jgi:energy-coupling factor transporter ATP-binding protein EcfA2
MGMNPAAGVFGHRNARSKTPIEVARGFVPPPQYWEIAQPGNTVLVGPRGSGKTTLLKMLQGLGLEHWQSPEAERAREMVTYSGIFVFADQSWSGQVTGFSKQLDDELRTSLGDACYTLHALRALARCAHVRATPSDSPAAHDRVEIDRSGQEQIVRGIWRGWALREPVGSFAGLAESLSLTLAEIGVLARRGIRRPEALTELAAHPALDLELGDAVVPFIERFNHLAGQEDHVWAFLIDEIEFLPPGIQGSILSSMRGRDPRLIRKISLAPYTLISAELSSNPLGGWEGHDLETVDLTFAEKEHGYGFSRSLIAKELEGLSLPLTPTELLGEGGYFERRPGKDAYAEGSLNAEAIASLAAKDPSFRAWMEDHRLDPQDPQATIGDRRAATLRKAIPVILLRDEYLHPVGGRLQFRSRKAAPTYTGELSAYAVCENNPRLLQTLVSRLLGASPEEPPSQGVKVEVIEGIAKQFSLHLRAIEVSESAPADLLPMRLVERIGQYFKGCLYATEFDPEPPLSFEFPVDPFDDVVLSQVLSQLVFYGAIVAVADRRFRLAHTFAPLFYLPLRKGRPHVLKNIISQTEKLSPRQLPISGAEQT